MAARPANPRSPAKTAHVGDAPSKSFAQERATDDHAESELQEKRTGESRDRRPTWLCNEGHQREQDHQGANDYERVDREKERACEKHVEEHLETQCPAHGQDRLDDAHGIV